MVDVVLIHPPADVTPLKSGGRASSEYPMMPVGFFTMAEYLSRHGINVRIINLAIERLLAPHASAIQLLRGLEADVVGVSLHWFVHSYGAIEVAKIVKRMLPDSKVVLGGFTASFYAEEIVRRYPFVDAVIVGEGEEALLDLAKRVSAGGEIHSVDGLVARKGRRILRTGRRKPVDDIDKYCFTKVDLYDRWQLYLKCSPSSCVVTRRPAYWLAIARSCPMGCIYCGGCEESYRVTMGRDKPVLRDPSRIADDVAVLVNEYGVEVVKFSHDPLIWGRKFYLKLMKEIAERGVEARTYWDMTLIPDDELIRNACRAFEGGICWGLSIETLDDEVRLKAGRRYLLRDIEKMLPLAKRYEVLLDAYFLIGLPGDTVDNVKRIVDYSFNLMEKYDNVYVIPPFPYTMDPNAPMALHSEKYGVKKVLKSLEDYRRIARSESWIDWVAHETRELSRKDIARLTEEVHRKIVEAYRKGEFSENVAKRFSFEHEGALLTP